MSRYLSCARDSSMEWNGIRLKKLAIYLITVQFAITYSLIIIALHEPFIRDHFERREKMIIKVMSKFDERMSTVGISDIGISGTEIAMKKSGKCFMPVVNSAILPTEDNVTTLGWWPLKL
ncbi:hypothetical protein BY996DRAFT_6417396 [Phakopsora pachyrhizi]|nr:hypothetical protein BY996DRAFT_6417396 [Phakopsora pachyrhizi]